MSKALTDLLAKVEAGGLEGTCHFSKGFGLQPDNRHLMGWSAYNGSLDAAKALHIATMHERVVKKEVWSKRYGGTVELFLDLDRIGVGHSNEFASRAWLIAILKALIAKDQTND